MLTFARKFATLALIAFLSQFATAQLSGSYELKMPDGSPAVDGYVCEVEFTQTGSGALLERIYLDDPNDEELPEEMAGEAATVIPLDTGGFSYAWINRRGTEGLIVMNPRTGNYEVHVMTGPNAGRVTVLHRIR